MIRRISLGLVLLLVALAGSASHVIAQAEPTVVYLVRHAEKADESADPALTAEGNARAAVLAGLLSDSGITHIYSSDFVRTRATVEPLARRLGLETLIYDPRDLVGIASRLRNTPGRHLVSGHSNTTPRLVELLGGDPHSAIDEPSEYDRLYIVTLLPGGRASSVLLRYGELYGG
jgi:phosphohistidine phosphatase SixA